MDKNCDLSCNSRLHYKIRYEIQELSAYYNFLKIPSKLLKKNLNKTRCLVNSYFGETQFYLSHNSFKSRYRIRSRSTHILTLTLT